MPETRGTLYVVATPIGNLSDMSPRARQVLQDVEVIAAEDTRRTARMLVQFGIRASLSSLHEHNEQRMVPQLIGRLRAGARVALVSDAGTPLISDPGYRLVVAAHAEGLRVSPVPGPCAAVAALSVAGLPTDRFAFEGFLPARSAARRARLQALATEQRTLVFQETGRRLHASLLDMSSAFGTARRATIARELTKLHETLYPATLGDLAVRAEDEADMLRGELVVVVAGSAAGAEPEEPLMRLLELLLAELPLKQAVDLASRWSGAPRNRVYRLALALRQA